MKIGRLTFGATRAVVKIWSTRPQAYQFPRSKHTQNWVEILNLGLKILTKGNEPKGFLNGWAARSEAHIGVRQFVEL